MPTLTPSEIEQHMRNAGFPASEINTGIGVALAESGGNTTAHNSKPPDDSYGLFQINMLGSLGPDRRKRFGITKNTQLYDPAINAKAAYIVWQGSGWKAWTTYTSGKYKDKMPGGGLVDDAKEAVKGLNPVTGVADSINAATRSFVKGFVSMGGVLVGVVVLVLGFLLIMRNTPAAKTAVSAVAKVAK